MHKKYQVFSLVIDIHLLALFAWKMTKQLSSKDWRDPVGRCVCLSIQSNSTAFVDSYA